MFARVATIILLATLAAFAAAESAGASVKIEDAGADLVKGVFNEDSTNKIALKNQALLTFMADATRLTDPRAIDFMYEIIDRAQTWYDVGLTLEFFTKATGEARARIATDLADPKSKLSPQVRTALAYMLADYGRFYGEVSAEEEKAILELLTDKDPRVRAYITRAAQAIPRKETFDALMTQMLREKDEKVRSYIIDTLRQITGKSELGRDIDEWQSWREGNPEPELVKGFKTPDTIKGTYGELEIEFTDDSSGSGTPIWALPPYGLTNEIFWPGLSCLEDLGRITAISLPAIGPNFEVVKDADGIELYPVDKLVESLEALREERKEPKVVLLGFQDASFILLRYAQLHPDKVKALILISGWMDRESYIASLDQLKMGGTEEESLYVYSATSNTGGTSGFNLSESQTYSVRIGRLASILDQPQDVHGCFLWEKVFDLRNHRTLLVPEVVLDKKEKIETPALFLHGEKDQMNSIKYTSFQGKLFLDPRPKVVEIPGSGPMPWHDTPDAFLKEVESFLSKIK